MNCKRRYADLIKPLELEYSTSWEEEILDLNKISVLAIWKPAFTHKTNSWIGGYQRFFIAVSATPQLQNFGKLSWKYWLSGFRLQTQVCRLCFFWRLFYWTNIYQWYFNIHWNIHPEVFYTSTLNSMTHLADDLLFHKIIYF